MDVLSQMAMIGGGAQKVLAVKPFVPWLGRFAYNRIKFQEAFTQRGDVPTAVVVLFISPPIEHDKLRQLFDFCLIDSPEPAYQIKVG